MLVKNTIIALMAVAPAFTIPVPATGKSTTTTVATTKSTTPTAAKVSKAAVTKPNTKVSKAAVTNANTKVTADLSAEKKLRKELSGLDSKLARDRSTAKELKQERGQQKANKHNLRITTTGHAATRHSVTPPGSALGTPRSGRSSLRSAVQSPYLGGFQSPGFSPPFSSGMSEDVTFTPKTGGGYTERISWSPQRQQIGRRALTPTTPSAVTPTTPSASLSPTDAYIPSHKSRKSSTVHKHTLREAMQLSALLVEAEKVVNGLEGQMNTPQTVFANLKRKSKSKRPTTPTTPATPATPPPVRTT
jgi:hypothetical protein